MKSSFTDRVRTLAVLLLLVAFLSGCLQQEDTSKASYTDVSALEARELIENTPDLVIIDVSPNYARGHIPGAVNYYLGDGSLDNAIPTLDMKGKYLIYCHSDSASITAAQKLIDAGFKTVYRLEGNFRAWVNAGYEVETS